MMNLKRRRPCSPRSVGCSLCEVLDIPGTLSDNTDMLMSMSKVLMMALGGTGIKTFVSAVQSLASKSDAGRIRIASMCSGSGPGDIAVATFIKCLSRSEEHLPEIECVFLCENNPQKAKWLQDMALAHSSSVT